LNARESFLRVMRFEKGVPSLKAEFGYWTTTVKHFLREGMPRVQDIPDSLSDNGTISGADKADPQGSEFTDLNVRSFFHLQSYVAKFPCTYSPLFETRVLEEDAESRTVIDQYGITKKERKTGTSPPLDIRFPIESRRDFEAYKEHYTADFNKRLPRDWPRLSQRLSTRDFPIRLGGFPYGFLGFPRHLMGTEGLFFAMYDDPQLVKDINEFFLRFVMDYWSPIIEQVRPDCVMIWEDMASGTGSMISREAFREFLSPFYVRIIDFLRQHGVENIHVDCDGYIGELIPLWVELGVTGLFPLERKAGNDLLKIRESFPRLQLVGGVDKRILEAGNKEREIDRELAIVRRVLSQGGYIPHVDHHVPDDSRWENFKLYREKLNLIIDSTGT
jgi:Uroporphyrinogen decarboxylase (URO-D).